MNISFVILRGMLVWLVAAMTFAEDAVEVTESQYLNESKSKGLVLLDLYWARVWGCGKYENAQLHYLKFERNPFTDENSESKAIVFDIPSRLAPPKGFVSFAVLLEPGDYYLTGYEVGFAVSLKDVRNSTGYRHKLVEDNGAAGGKFSVTAGEAVYIGNFAIDCYSTPIPWRYYTETKENFEHHKKQYRDKYPFISTDNVVFRLFSTKTFGADFELK